MIAALTYVVALSWGQALGVELSLHRDLQTAERSLGTGSASLLGGVEEIEAKFGWGAAIPFLPSWLALTPIRSNQLSTDNLRRGDDAWGKRNYAESRAYFLQAYIELKHDKAAADQIVRALKGAADCSMMLRDFLAADEEYRLAIENSDDKSTESYAWLLRRRGEALRSIGRIEEGWTLLREAARIIEAMPEDYQRLRSIYSETADYAFWAAKWNDGVFWAQKRIALVRKHDPGSIAEAAALHQIIEPISMVQGWAPARAYTDQWIAILRRLCPESPTMANAYQYLRDSELSIGNKAKAREYAFLAQQMFARTAPTEVQCHVSLLVYSGFLIDEGRNEEAVRGLERAWRMFREQNQNKPLDIIGKTPRHADFAVFASMIMRQLNRVNEDEMIVEILQEIQGRSLSQLLLNQIRLRNPQRAAELDQLASFEEQISIAGQSLAESSLKVGSSQAEIARLKAEGKPTSDAEGKYQALEEKRLADQVKVAQLQAKLESASKEVRKKNPQAFPKAIPLADCPKYLPSKSVYLGFIFGDAPNLSLAVVRPTGSVDLIELRTDMFKLREQVNALRSKLLSRNPSVYEDLRALYTALIPQSIRREVEEAESLIITPDGPLWELPFAALLAGSDDSPYYLGLAKPIVITPSLSLYGMAQVAGSQKKPSASISAAVVGDPIFSWQGGSQLASSGERSVLWTGDKAPPQLPGTKKEAEAIAALYQTEAITGGKATETYVRSQLRSAQILHIATHGYVNNDYPMASGLLLSAPRVAPSSPAGDGALLAWEVFQSPASSPHLVVLSACETGLGRSLRAEGVDGLVRSFQVSGVPSIVSSLWKVDDASTSDLMTEFHRNVRAGKPYHESVCLAMTKVYSNPETQEPYFWAPFFLVGDQTNRLYQGK